MRSAPSWDKDHTGLPVFGQTPAFPSAIRHFTLDAPLQNSRFSFPTSVLLKSHMCFPGRYTYWSLRLRGFSLICIFLSLAPVVWSFLVPSPLHPDGSSVFSSVPHLCPGHRPLVALTTICSDFSHTFAFCTRLSSVGRRNSVMLFLCPQYPGQYLGPSGIEVQEVRLQSRWWLLWELIWQHEGEAKLIF